MKNVLSVSEKTTAPEAVRRVLSSRLFPFFTAAVILVCTYLALDLVMIYYMAIVLIVMLVMSDDLTPLVGHLLFLNVLSSEENSPSALLHKSQFLSQPAVIAQIAVLAALIVLAFVYRFIVLVRARSYRPDGTFWGLCALSVALLLNGAGAAEYNPMNLAYGAVLAFAFLGIFTIVAGNVRRAEENFRTIGWAFAAFSLLLLVELSVRYSVIWEEVRDFFGDSSKYSLIKSKIVFGWGNWNTIGMLLAVSIPPVFLLAGKYRHGWILTLFAALVTLGAVASFSRQALFAAIVCFSASALVTMITGRRRALHIATVCAVLFVTAIVLIARREWVAELYRMMIDNLFNDEGDFTGNARVRLLYASLDFFTANPAFGSGWYIDFQSHGSADFANFGFVPLMAHNTFGQLIASCGMAGILAYCAHRVQTVIAFAEHPSVNKLFLAFALAAMLLMSLVDNHIFYLLPTAVYSALLAFTCGKGEDGKAPIPEPSSDRQG